MTEKKSHEELQMWVQDMLDQDDDCECSNGGVFGEVCDSCSFVADAVNRSTRERIAHENFIWEQQNGVDRLTENETCPFEMATRQAGREPLCALHGISCTNEYCDL